MFVNLIILSLVFFMVFLSIFYKERKKQNRLKEERTGFTKLEFSNYFLKRGIPQEFSCKVYDYLQSLLKVSGVPIFPNDKIDEVLGIGVYGGVMLDEIIEEFFDTGNVSIKMIDNFMNENTWSGEVENLVDLLFFLSKVS